VFTRCRRSPGQALQGLVPLIEVALREGAVPTADRPGNDQGVHTVAVIATVESRDEEMAERIRRPCGAIPRLAHGGGAD
jgi:hypothetical protein